MNKKDTLKEKILKAQENGDIAALYVLENDAHELLDEETLYGFYMNILDLALERLTDILQNHRKLDIAEVQDFATLRALYEYAIEHYHAKEFHDAAALFEVLSGISNDENFSKAMKIHQVAAQEKLDIDTFLEKIADVSKTQQEGTFYISKFSKEAQKLLDDSQDKGK